MEYFSKKKDNEETKPTEIEMDDFLQNDKADPNLYVGFHEDIEKTEKSLENELQSLYDDIMSSGPATIVPKPLSVIASETVNKEDEAPADEYAGIAEETFDDEAEEIEFEDISSVSEEPKPIKMEIDEVEPKEEKTVEPFNSESTKDDIFSLIASLKSSSESETGFSDILSEIKENPEIQRAVPEVVEKAPKTERLEAAFGKPSLIPEIQNSEPAPIKGEDPEPIELEAIETIELEDIIGNKPQKADKKVAPEKKQKEKKNDKPASTGEIVRRIVLVASIIIIVVSLGVLANTYIIQPALFKKNSKDIQSDFDASNNEVVSAVGDSEYPAGMLAKYTQLYDINSDIAGWISIPALEIDFPIAQGTDNDYYLHRNIYKKYADYGVPFFDYRMTDLKNLHRNNVVYGHNMKNDDLIFGMLENYRKVDFFKKNPVIECNTIYGDHTWFICAVFITNSTKGADNGYVFPYNFVDIDDDKFVSYIEEIKKRSFYDTGVDIEITDKLLTLSTCCYDFNDARLVVVAREKRANESANINVSGAKENPNPKYPQAWYDAKGKTNPYANDAKW